MKQHAQNQTLPPIEPDSSIKPDMGFSDRAPLVGVTVRESRPESFAAAEAALNLRLHVFAGDAA